MEETYTKIEGGADTVIGGNCSVVGGLSASELKEIKYTKIEGGRKSMGDGAYSFIGGGYCQTAQSAKSGLPDFRIVPDLPEQLLNKNRIK